MKKIFACAAVLGALRLSTAAFADQPANNPPAQPGANASACGAVHGAFASVNGNFGFIGQDFQGAPNHSAAEFGSPTPLTGQDAGATGERNSHTDCQNKNLP